MTSSFMQPPKIVTEWRLPYRDKGPNTAANWC